MEANHHPRTTNLQELSRSDFEIADHQPDINGWELIDAEGNEIGEVIDLIFDLEESKVRYIVADIEDLNDHKSGYVLIPIGIVTLDEDEEEVIVPQDQVAAIYTLPAFESGKTISPVEELAIRYAFLGSKSLPHADSVVYETHPDDFYTHEHFRDEHFKRNH
jgi:sporulation protein YlmC with PRC-barrel domain